MIIIIHANRYRRDVIFSENNLIFFSSKNIITNRLYKKLNSKRFKSFSIKSLIDFLYRLTLLKIIKIHDVFYSKLLILAIINSLFD